MEKLYMDAEEVFFEEQGSSGPRRTHRNPGMRRAICALLILAAMLAGLCGFFSAYGFDLPFFRETATLDNGWNLILVNDQYYIPDDFVGELVTLSNGQKVDRRIYPALQQMFDDMRSQNVYPVVASGYRTEEEQQVLLSERIDEYISIGYSWFEAYKKARNWVAKPGTSEHQLGIAVDINQEGTKSTASDVYEWLEENAHLYGFTYRYPQDKVSITGIGNEPWHYRFVGVEVATILRESGICLEEYLDVK